MPKARRRKVDPAERLSDQMRDILLWAYRYKLAEPRAESSDSLTKYVDEKLVPWRPSEIVGGDLTPSKRITLSNTLKRLEERGLLVRYSVGYKNGKATRMAKVSDLNNRARTTHVGLTTAGSLRVIKITDPSFDLAETEAKKKRRLLESRVEGLDFALTLLHRERVKQMVEAGVEPVGEMLQSLEAINKSLEQMAKGEFEEKARKAHDAVRASLAEARKELESE